MARSALFEKLKPHYNRVELEALSNTNKTFDPAQKNIIEMHLTTPVSKRVCVWLIQGKQRIPVWFQVKAFQPVFVARQRLQYNTPVLAEAFTKAERDVAELNSQPALSLPEQAWLKSSLEPGKILLQNQLIDPPQVLQGQSVKVQLMNQHIRLIMDAQALGNGYLGQTIRVKNPLNQQTFSAKVTGLGLAEITS